MVASLLVLAAPAYRIVDLGLPPGAKAVYARAINNRGEVLVNADDKSFLWRAGRFIRGGDPSDGRSMRADALNDHGAVVGAIGSLEPIFNSGAEDKKAFVWNGHTMTLLFPGDSVDEEATGINDLGDIVGTDANYAFARLRGKVWGLPTMSHVETPGQDNDLNASYGVAISDRRQILMNSTYGRPEDGHLRSRPFLVDGNDQRLRTRPVPLPKGFVEGQGLALNDRGTVLAVATHALGTDATPCLARGGRIVRLPFAGAMNGRDEVVGGSPLAIWQAGRTRRLPSFPGWTLQTATGINDRDAICGTGLHDGKARAYVLLPGSRVACHAPEGRSSRGNRAR